MEIRCFRFEVFQSLWNLETPKSLQLWFSFCQLQHLLLCRSIWQRPHNEEPFVTGRPQLEQKSVSLPGIFFPDRLFFSIRSLRDSRIGWLLLTRLSVSTFLVSVELRESISRFSSKTTLWISIEHNQNKILSQSINIRDFSFVLI